MHIRLQLLGQVFHGMVQQIRSWTGRSGSVYLINERPHRELPAIHSQWQPAVLLLEEIERPLLARDPVLDPVGDDDGIKWQNILADVTLLAEVCPTMPVDS